jgi:hypothetical protein
VITVPIEVPYMNLLTVGLETAVDCLVKGELMSVLMTREVLGFLVGVLERCFASFCKAESSGVAFNFSSLFAISPGEYLVISDAQYMSLFSLGEE